MTYPSVARFTAWRARMSLARFRFLPDAIAWALANEGTRIRHGGKTIWRKL